MRPNLVAKTSSSDVVFYKQDTQTAPRRQTWPSSTNIGPLPIGTVPDFSDVNYTTAAT